MRLSRSRRHAATPPAGRRTRRGLARVGIYRVQALKLPRRCRQRARRPAHRAQGPEAAPRRKDRQPAAGRTFFFAKRPGVAGNVPEFGLTPPSPPHDDREPHELDAGRIELCAELTDHKAATTVTSTSGHRPAARAHDEIRDPAGSPPSPRPASPPSRGGGLRDELGGERRGEMRPPDEACACAVTSARTRPDRPGPPHARPRSGTGRHAEAAGTSRGFRPDGRAEGVDGRERLDADLLSCTLIPNSFSIPSRARGRRWSRGRGHGAIAEEGGAARDRRRVDLQLQLPHDELLDTPVQILALITHSNSFPGKPERRSIRGPLRGGVGARAGRRRRLPPAARSADEAAVHADGLSREVRRAVRAEERDERSDVVRLARTGASESASGSPPCLLRQEGDHLGLDEARSDGSSPSARRRRPPRRATW